MATASLRDGPATGLVERADELAVLEAALDRACSGVGSVVLLEGVPGVGKTALLRAAQAGARTRLMQVTRAACAELERDFAFGVARTLYAPLLDADDSDDLFAGAARLARGALDLLWGEETPPVGADPSAAIIHGLYWLTVNLCDRGPLVIAVDDLHWADAASARFLAYLGRRVADLPLVLVLTSRTEEASEGYRNFASLSGQPGVETLTPSPLSGQGVPVVVERILGEAPDADFASACLRATGGNPFLLRELLLSLAASGVEPIAPNSRAVSTAKPEAIVLNVIGRIKGLPGSCALFADALAAWGRGATTTQIARLADLDPEEAAFARDILTTAGIVQPRRELDFAHPLLRTVILDQVPQGRRSVLHARAAGQLAASGAPPDRVAAHLMNSDPDGRPWAVEILRQSAQNSLNRGANPTAVVQLQRALAEPPPPEDEWAVLFELGRAEARGFMPDSLTHLGAAADGARTIHEHASAGRELGQALMLFGRLPESLAAFERASNACVAQDPSLAAELELEYAGAARFDIRTRADAVRRLHDLEGRPLSPIGRRRLLANLALEAVSQTDVAGVCRLAREALADGELLAAEGGDSPTVWYPIFSLLFCDQFEEAAVETARVLEEATRQGSARGAALASAIQAMAAFRRGRMAEAEQHAHRLLDHPGAVEVLAQPFAVDALLRALLEVGRIKDATVAVSDLGFGGEIFDMPLNWPAMSARGLVRAANGDPSGVEDCLEAGARGRAWGSRSPAMLPWRTDAATILLATGQRKKALELAEEAVELASSLGAPRCLGQAMRVRAQAIADADDRLKALDQAAAVLSTSGAELEHAHALVELGSNLRRRGQRVAAREHLSRARELAHRAAAEPLAERARLELLAAGGRPRRLALSGADALTVSERRVAELAASGYSNPEIAQRLFVGTKTVETHLSHVFRKLGVGSRTDLSDALNP